MAGQRFWFVRAGVSGETKALVKEFQDERIVAIACEEVNDISDLMAKDGIEKIRKNPEWNGWSDHDFRYLDTFVNEIKQNDVVLTSIPSTREILIGEIKGKKCEYRGNREKYCLIREVKKWRKVSRDYFNEAAKNSFSTQGHWVFRVDKHKKVILKILNSKDSANNNSDANGKKGPPSRSETTTQRFDRDSKLARELKAQYKYKCQVCGLSIRTSGNRGYAEANHLRPLEHGGDDRLDNLLVVCPNHHKEFDLGGIAIKPSDCESLVQRSGGSFSGKRLHFEPNHRLSRENVRYHYRKIYRGKKFEEE